MSLKYGNILKVPIMPPKKMKLFFGWSNEQANLDL
jgi:hypothetical protein